MRHMLGNLSPNYFERTKRYMMLRASQQGTDLTVSGTPPLSLPNSLGKPLKAWSVDLLPYQEGTGDPAPDNVRPIHGTDKLTITTAGKNLLGINEAYGAVSGITITDGVATGSNIVFNYALVSIPNYLVGKSLTWTVKVAVPATITRVYAQANVNGSNINGNDVMSGTTGITTVSFTPTSTSDYLRLTYGSGNDNITVSDFQLELGSTATTYTPYIVPSQTVLTLPQTVYTGTIGSEGGESRTAVVDLGTLNWTVAGNANVFYSTGLNRANLNTASAIYRCEKYVYRGIAPGNSQAYVNGNNSFTVYSGADARVWIRDDAQWGDIAAFKASLQGVLLEYELVNPQTFPLTAPTIPTPTGTATTWATAEDGTVDGMEVTYVGKA